MRVNPEEHEQCSTEELTKTMNGLFHSAYEGDVRVLVVDDEKSDRELMKEFFRRKGIRAQGVTVLERVWEMVKVFDPHFIVLDIRGVDDFEKIFKAFKEKIIICTSLNGDMNNTISREARACFGKKDMDKVVEYVIKETKEAV